MVVVPAAKARWCYRLSFMALFAFSSILLVSWSCLQIRISKIHRCHGVTIPLDGWMHGWSDDDIATVGFLVTLAGQAKNISDHHQIGSFLLYPAECVITIQPFPPQTIVALISLIAFVCFDLSSDCMYEPKIWHKYEVGSFLISMQRCMYVGIAV